MAEKICAIVCGALAIVSAVISIRSLKEKGFLFNNAYIWASKQEREKMNKKPHYRQTAIAFALITVIFACMAVECVLQTGWLWIIVGVVSIAVLVYAIASSVKESTK